MCMYLHVSVGIISVSALIMMMYLLISLRLACQYIHPSVPWLRPSSITAPDRPNLGGPAPPRWGPILCCTSRAPRPSLSCMLFPCLTSWASRLSFLQGITSPLPKACMTARRRATHWANAIGVASPAQTASCCSLKNKIKFQSKWSLLLCSATRDAQCSPIAHIKPQWTVAVSWYMQIHANTCT